MEQPGVAPCYCLKSKEARTILVKTSPDYQRRPSMAKKILQNPAAGKKNVPITPKRPSREKTPHATIIRKPAGRVVKKLRSIPKEAKKPSAIKKITRTPKQPSRKKAPYGTMVRKRTGRVDKKIRSIPKKVKKSLPVKKITPTQKPPLPRTAKNTARLPKPPVKLFADANDLPMRYDATRLALIARDPHWIYAYWEIDPQTQRAVKRKMGPGFKKATYVLRVYDITKDGVKGSRAGRSFDFCIEPPRQSAYVELPRDNARYRAELVVRSPLGKDFLVAQSNSVSTPNAGVSENSGETWLKVKHSEGVAPTIVQTILEHKKPDQFSQPPYAAEMSGGAPQQFAGQPVLELLPIHDAEPKSGWPLDTAPLSEMNIKSGPDGVSHEPMNIAPESLRIGSSENMARRGDFPFGIETELIVRGRTAADALVWLNSDRVPVTAEGTFYLHFDLPGGEAPLRFSALSSSAMETKTITTSVVRTPTISH